MDKKSREDFLKSVYEFEVKKGNRNTQINKASPDDNNYRESLKIIDYWSDKGVIEKVAHAAGFIVIKLTSYGIDYVEENL